MRWVGKRGEVLHYNYEDDRSLLHAGWGLY